MTTNVRDIIKALEEYAASLPETTGDQELAKSAAQEMQAFFSDLRKAVNDLKAEPPAQTEQAPTEAEKKAVAAAVVQEAQVRKADTIDFSEALQKALEPVMNRIAALEAAKPSGAVEKAEETDEEPAEELTKAVPQDNVEEKVRQQVAEQLRKMGFMPSEPTVQRTTLGYEQTSFVGKALPGQINAGEVSATYDKVKEIQNMSFAAINRLRTQANAW